MVANLTVYVVKIDFESHGLIIVNITKINVLLI